MSTTADDRALFDGREMFMVHAVFRRELGLAPALVRGVAAGDRERAQVVAGHIQGVTQLLRHHHESEDMYNWPLLLERAADKVAPLVATMEAQHEEVAKRGQEVIDALAVFGETASTESREALAGALDRLLPVLTEHLTVEEQEVVPLMEQYITMAEWQEMVRSGAADADPESIPLGFGMLMYEGDPEVIDAAITTMPPEVQPVIRQASTAAYAAHAELVHGTATPPRSTEL